jgi:hypothetical protein
MTAESVFFTPRLIGCPDEDCGLGCPGEAACADPAFIEDWEGKGDGGERRGERGRFRSHSLFHLEQSSPWRFPNMKHLNGTYSLRLNRRYGWDGPLFRDRYTNVIADSDEYLKQLVAYPPESSQGHAVRSARGPSLEQLSCLC